MTDPRWAAVVVNYESGPPLTACVESLLADDTAGGPPEVVVVDNGSADGSIVELHQAFPAVPVIRPGANLGYSRAANLGIAATRAPIVAVLNPDAEIARGTAAALVARFDEDDRLAAVGPQIANPDGTRYPSARSAPSLGDAIGHAVLGSFMPDNRYTRSYRQLAANPETSRAVGWVSGAAVWLRRDALDRVGGWDERFFLFFEDVDLCRRLGADGWGIVYEPGGHVVHAVGRSRAHRPIRSIFEHHRAAYQYAAKWWHGPRRLLLPVAAAFLAARGAVVAGGAAAQAGVEEPPRPPSNLNRAMAKASKYNRARIRSRVRRPKRRGGSTIWTVITAVVIVVGVALVVFTVSDRKNTATAAPTIGDHWHTFLGVDICGTWLPNAPSFEDRAQEAGVHAGLHSHGDGLMHIHPFSSDEAGTKATVGRFISYGGWDLSDTGFSLWDGQKHENGQKCGTGANAKKAEVQWIVGRYAKPWPTTPRTGNPSDYHPKNGDIVAIYLLPKGAKLPKPPDADSALANIEDLGGAPVNTPTTVPGASTTTSPPIDNSSTSSTTSTTAP